MNRIVIGILVVVVLVIGALFAVPAFVDFNEYKAEIGERVARATGRQFTIDGDIDLKLLPAPALAVKGLSLGNIDGATAPDMVRIESLEVRVALLPLLGGDIQVEKIRFVKPVVVLESLPDGRENWRFNGSSAAGETPAATPSDDGGTGLDNIRIDHVEVVDGTVTLVRDGRTVSSITAFDGQVSATTLAGPFKIAGTGTVGGQALRFDAGIGRLEGTTSIPLTANVSLADDAARLQFSGSASKANIDATVRGTVKAEGQNLGQAVRDGLAAMAKPVAVPPWLNQPFSARMAVDASAREASLNDIALQVGDTVATGAVSTAYADGLSVDATMKIKRVDLDSWLSSAAPAGGEQPAASTGSQDGSPPATAAKFTVPKDVSGSLSLEIDALSWRRNVIRQIQLETEADDGVVTIKRLSALAPGGSDISLAGALANDQSGTATFDGTLEASSDNLRALLNWLDVDAGGVPADRLRNIQLMATVRATPEVVQAYGMDLRIDSSRFVGGVAYALRARPSFGVDFKVDRINLDAYLGATGGTGDSASSGGAAPGNKGVAANPAATTAFLNSFDANIKISADHVTYAGLPAQGINLDASLIGGALDVRRLTVGNLAGVSLGASASAGDFGENPSIKLNSVVRSNDLSEVARLLDLDTPFPVKDLGASEATVKADGTLQDMNFDLTAKTEPATITLSGRTRPLRPTDDVDLKVAVVGDSLSHLLTLFGTDLANDAPYRLAGTVKGGNDAYGLALQGKVAGADIEFSDQIKRAAAGGFGHDGSLRIHHPDLTAFVRSFGVKFDPAARNLGGFSVESALSGSDTDMAFSDIAATFGPLSVQGNAAVHLSGPRPRIDARLQANEILADLFLPVPTTGPRGRIRSGTEIRSGASEPQERWSRDPIDLSPLTAFDADVAIKAPSMNVMGYAVSKPRLAVKLDDGILDVEKLDGRLFDGAFDFAAKVDARGEPSARVSVKLADGQLEQALMQSAGIGAVTGTFSFDGTFDTHGTSQFDAISALNGKGRLTAHDGIIRGLDMRRLSDSMQSLHNRTAFLNLLDAALSQGETAFQDLKGTVTVTQGVIRSDDLTATLDASVGQAQGTVDLPRWFIDGTGEFRLTEHKNAPPIAIVLRGPLNNPQKTLNTRRLTSFLVSRFGTDLLNKALGIKEDKPAQTSPTSPAPVFGAPAAGSDQKPAPAPSQSEDSKDPLKRILRKGIEGVLGN